MGTKKSPSTIIYSTLEDQNKSPLFRQERQIELMQQHWLMIWESAPAFERSTYSKASVFILTGGLLFTFMFSLFLLTLSFQRTETIQWMIEQRKARLPFAVFILIFSGSWVLYHSLKLRDSELIMGRTEFEANKIQTLILNQISNNISTLQHIANRWEKLGGLPSRDWQEDAKFTLSAFSSIRTLEWVDIIRCIYAGLNQ